MLGPPMVLRRLAALHKRGRVPPDSEPCLAATFLHQRKVTSENALPMTSANEPSTTVNLHETLDVFAPADADAIPIHLVPAGPSDGTLPPAAQRWAETIGFKGASKAHALIPDANGSLAAVLLGAGDGQSGDPSGPSDLLLGQLAGALPEGTYRLGGGFAEPGLAALSWALGAYRFRRYKSGNGKGNSVRLAAPAGLDMAHVLNTAAAVWLGRDLINTPASDLGPAEVEAAVRAIGSAHNATVRSVVGDDLLAQNFPMIHAVGRASPRAPRLIELDWQKPGGRPDAPKITLVGKGITFDTGGLDIKPASAMLIMKKDMGGAAVAIALAHMIMGQGLDVRLKLLIASAENSISGDAFRPGDILHSRAGHTVEIGNTDAEGRLVLADALALADEGAPDSIFVFATLTGAARTALGPELPALFTNDDALAAALQQTGVRIGDPLWRLPLWPGYDHNLDSDIADMNNVWETPFAGSITAALFLKRFVKIAKRFAHFDLYGWRPGPRPLGPKGGEVQIARTVLEIIRAESEAGA
jgi:leucyl aminopeptidase